MLWSPTMPLEAVLTTMEQTGSFAEFKTAGADSGIVLLGTPMGSAAFVHDAIMKEAPLLQLALDRLHRFQRIQTRMLLVRYCTPQRLNHIIRTVPPSQCARAVQALDLTILQAFGSLQGFASTHPTWARLLRLPQRLGGTGLTAAAEIAPLAYIASVADTARNIDLPAFSAIRADFRSWLGAEPTPTWAVDTELDDCLSRFLHGIHCHQQLHPGFAVELMDKPASLPRSTRELLTTEPKLQQRLSRLLNEVHFESIKTSAHLALRTRMLSNSQPGASSCYDAIPSCAKLSLHNPVFSHFLRQYQAISELEPQSFRCPCNRSASDPPEGALVDSMHWDLCRLGGGMTARHNHVAAAVDECLCSGGFLTRPQYRAQGPGARPDIEVYNFPYPGTNAYVEVSITSPFQSQQIHAASQHPLRAADAREEEKRRKYREMAVRNRYNILPAVMESTGAFGRSLQQILATTASAAKPEQFANSEPHRTWASRSFPRYWSQRIAIAFWQGSFAMLQCAAQVCTTRGVTHPSSPADPPSLSSAPSPRNAPSRRTPDTASTVLPFTASRTTTPPFPASTTAQSPPPSLVAATA